MALDRRGHGRSDVPGDGDDLDTLADDLAGLLEHLDLREVTVVARSMGTCQDVRLLARHGSGRVARIALLGAMTPHLAGAFVEVMVVDLVADRPRWFHDSAPAYFATAGTGSWVSRAPVDDGVRQILTTPLEVQVACLRSLHRHRPHRRLATIDVPALVVHGNADASAPLDLTGRPTAKLLRHARFRLVEGAPHGLYVTAKNVLNAELIAFTRGEDVT